MPLTLPFPTGKGFIRHYHGDSHGTVINRRILTLERLWRGARECRTGISNMYSLVSLHKKPANQHVFPEDRHGKTKPTMIEFVMILRSIIKIIQ